MSIEPSRHDHVISDEMLNGDTPRQELCSNDRSMLLHVRRLLATAASANSSEYIRALTQLGSLMSPDDGTRFAHAHGLDAVCPLTRHHYETVIFEAEAIEAARLLTGSGGRADVATSFGKFGVTSYNRVSDMFDHVNFNSCQRFVLVGCGALPVTMFQVMNNTVVPEIVGIDPRPDAIAQLRSMIDGYDFTRLSGCVVDGRYFDYQAVDVVYVANLVAPKREVLAQIARTAPSSVKVIVREPYSFGHLMTECATEPTSDAFEVVVKGVPSPAYMSRNVFVRRA